VSEGLLGETGPRPLLAQVLRELKRRLHVLTLDALGQYVQSQNISLV